jgi:phage/plasmid-associated DNA primase
MDPYDMIQEQERKIQLLEKELIELRQGLATVQDFFSELATTAQEQDAAAEVDQALVRPLLDEDVEFESIWDFHQKMLVPDPKGSIPLKKMFETYAGYCRNSGRKPIDQDAFEFLLPQMDNPRPIIFRGKWQNCRIR